MNQIKMLLYSNTKGYKKRKTNNKCEFYLSILDTVNDEVNSDEEGSDKDDDLLL